MSDLAIGCVLITLLGIGLFLLTQQAARHLSHLVRTLILAGVVAGLFVYVRTLWYDVRLASWLPLSNLIVVANWLPLFAALIAGLMIQADTFRRLWPCSLICTLATVGALAALYPLLGTAPKCGDRWDKLGTCLQTTRATCSPAAAATLLHMHGIPATEQELAELCLTRQGTSWQGLYRGLKLKTAGTEWDVRVCALSADEILKARTAPLIISVGLDRTASANTDFTREFGWVPGVNHSVVIERFSSTGSAVIADPASEMCREQWSPEMLRTLWKGYAFRLVHRGSQRDPR